MSKRHWRFYIITLVVLFSLSVYPLATGGKILALYWRHGSVLPQDYARYVVPYTALCLSVLLTAAAYPWLSRLRRPALWATAVAAALFLGLELYIEGITIQSEAFHTAAQLQLFSCVYTPAAQLTYSTDYTAAFRIHYFLVSFVLLTLAMGVIYGCGRRVAKGDRQARVPLALQTSAFSALLGLCVFANLTGFFRERTDLLPPLSAMLTGLFFVVLGAAAGLWLGSLLMNRSRTVRLAAPAALAAAVCVLMYVGEYQLLGGSLYRLGRGWVFGALPLLVLSPADIGIVFLSAAVTILGMATVGATRKSDTPASQAGA